MNHSDRAIPVLLASAALTLSAGCCHCPPPPPPVPAICPAVPPPPPPPAPAPAATAPKAPSPAKPNVVVVKNAGVLSTPECVLWDPKQDVYFVANINGNPSELDKNGFISKVAPDGKVIDLKWIDGTKKGVDLSAPKGMAIAGNLLFVADINTVRRFDRKTGRPKGAIAIKDATFLNGLAVSPDGKTLYVSDSAVKIDKSGFAGTGNDAIYEIPVTKKIAKPLVKDKSLHWPNGLLADKDGVWVVTLGKNQLIHVNKKGEIGAVTKLPKGSLDGIVKLNDGSFLISSWEASAVYRGLPGGQFSELVTDVPSPASIGLDSKRRNLLIPIFTGNTVEIHPLPILPVLEPPAAPPAAAKPPTPPPPPAPPAPARAAKPAAAPAPAPAAAPAAKPATPPTAPAPAAPAPAAKPAAAPAAKPAAPAPAPAPATPAPAAKPAAAQAPAPAAAAPAAKPLAPAREPTGPQPAKWK